MTVGELIKQARELINEMEDPVPFFKKPNKKTKLLTVYNRAGKLLGQAMTEKSLRNLLLKEITEFEQIGDGNIIDKYQRIDYLKKQIAKESGFKVFLKTNRLPKQTTEKVEKLITKRYN